MIFGDPNTFAILVEKIPQWTMPGSYVNGMFHFIIDGKHYVLPLQDIFIEFVASNIVVEKVLKKDGVNCLNQFRRGKKCQG